MTHYYTLIRREIYELRFDSKQCILRNILQMIKLFTVFHWVLFFIVIGSLAFEAVMLYRLNHSEFKVSIVFVFFPIIIVAMILLLLDIVPDKCLYKTDKRKQEIKEIKILHKKYLKDAERIFRDYKIDDSAMCIIKKECEDRLNSFKSKSENTKRIIIEIMFIVPLAAIVGLLVDASKEINTYGIALIIAIDIIVWGIFKLLMPMQNIWNGRFKDQWLLDTMNDIEIMKHSNIR